MRLHLVPEPLPQPLADLVVVRFGSTLPKARPGDHELRMLQDTGKARQQEISGTHAAVKLQCVRHRARIELSKGSVVAGIQYRTLQGEE